jgi:hypothetical protein
MGRHVHSPTRLPHFPHSQIPSWSRDAKPAPQWTQPSYERFLGALAAPVVLEAARHVAARQEGPQNRACARRPASDSPQFAQIRSVAAVAAITVPSRQERLGSAYEQQVAAAAHGGAEAAAFERAALKAAQVLAERRVRSESASRSGPVAGALAPPRRRALAARRGTWPRARGDRPYSPRRSAQ